MAEVKPIRSDDADHNLLFGVLALQADVISRSQFVEGCSAWATRKEVPLADVLAERGWLTAADRADVERLVQRKLKKHHGDARSLLAEVAGNEVRQTLAGVNDAAINRTMSGAPMTERPVATVDLQGGQRDRYRLSRLHSKGGIGQVWLAHDADLGRDVALKELQQESVKNPAVVTRFVEEARITGQLEHPGIVPVYELSQGAPGKKPFYTMRFIKGRTLSDAVRVYHTKREHGEAGPLDLRELLGAFVVVCNAVAYAHSRSIIHRDLKGSNVILGDFGEVMVLDWGLAKLLEAQPAPADAAETPVAPARADRPGSDELHLQPISINVNASRDLTLQGQVLGTPGYMAPEQAEGRLEAIDQRTDVYGLGAILYEILTGRPPFWDKDTLAILRRVINEAPEPPRFHVPATPPALEAVCLKALAKRPDARYPVATDVAREVQRWLADEPVTAYPESLTTRLGRWARRHKALVMSAAAILVSAVVALALGMVVLGEANRQKEEQRVLAEKARVEAQSQRNAAQHNAEEAQAENRRATKEAATKEALNKFLVDDILAEAAPERNARAKNVSVEEVLKKAAVKINSAFKEQPEVEASVRFTIGETFLKLGLWKEAEPHLQAAIRIGQELGPDHTAETLKAKNSLGEVYLSQERWPEAERISRETVDACRRLLKPEDKVRLESTNLLATILQNEGKLVEAEPVARETLADRQRALGGEDLFTLRAVNNLARLLQDRGKLGETEALLRQTLKAWPVKLGHDHPLYIAVTGNLGSLLIDEGRLDEAEVYLRQALESSNRVTGPNHPITVLTLNHLARLLERQNKLAEAESMCRRNLPACRQYLGQNHDKTLLAIDNLALVLKDQGKTAESEALLREALGIRRQIKPPGHYHIAFNLDTLGALLIDKGKAHEAEVLAREGLRLRKEGPDPGHWQAANLDSVLGAALTELGRFDEAEGHVLGGYQGLKDSPGTPTRRLREALERVVRLYTAWGKPDKAAEWAAQRQASPPAKNP
jgi:serine/threonine protein kinase/tetratricopeptide (TPR) repeat protein